MNIKCPKCDTVFEYRVDEGDRVKLKFKCSVCNNIWQHNALSDTDSLNNINSPNYNILFILHIVIIILIIISFIAFRKDLEFVDYYWQSIYLFFDSLIPVQ